MSGPSTVLKLTAASSGRWQELGASPLSLLPGEGYSLGSEMGQQALCMLPASHSRHPPAVEGTLPIPTAGQHSQHVANGLQVCTDLGSAAWDSMTMSLGHFPSGRVGGLPSGRGTRDPEGPLQEGSAAHKAPLSATFQVPPRAARRG